MSKHLTLQVFTPLSPKAQELMKKHDIQLEVGDFVIADRGETYKVTKINARGIEISSNAWTKDGSYSHYSTIKFEDWHSEKYLRLDGTPDEQMLKVLTESADLSKYEEDETPSESKDLMVVGDKNHLISMKKSAELVARKLEVMNRLLERKRNELEHIMRGYLAKVEAIQKVIGLIELYLGIHEQLVQIGQGQAAPADTPISMRQQVLFMDEELGDPTEGGIDFRRIEEFDKWLATDNNIAKLLPEEKGVVALRTRRHANLEYSTDWFTNSLMNAENKKVYILIRNGANIYRIYTDHLKIYERLFPLRKEMAALQKAVGAGGELSEEDEADDEEQDSDYRYSESDAKKQLERYRKAMLMLQGLLDRSEVFLPIAHAIQLHKPETYGDLVRFVYDDELTLGDGHLPWKEWKQKINDKITRGTRIYFDGFWTGFGSPYTSKDSHWESRFPYNMSRYAHGSSKPNPGVYSVVRTEMAGSIYLDNRDGKAHEVYVCQYMPSEKVWKRDRYYGGYEEGNRKRSVPFTIYKSDDFVFNYDLLDLKDIEFYIHSRADRRNYVRMMPVLYGLRRMRLKELEWERGFVEHLVGRLQGQDPKKAEASVWAAMEWWKRKVIWKRPLTKDDSKALRMITWKVKKEFGLKTTREDLLLPETLLKERKEKRRKRR